MYWSIALFDENSKFLIIEHLFCKYLIPGLTITKSLVHRKSCYSNFTVWGIILSWKSDVLHWWQLGAQLIRFWTAPRLRSSASHVTQCFTTHFPPPHTRARSDPQLLLEAAVGCILFVPKSEAPLVVTAWSSRPPPIAIHVTILG